MKPFASIIVSLAITFMLVTSAAATDYLYGWTISDSDTDPFSNTGTAAGGLKTLYLWLDCVTKDGVGSAEFDVSTTGPNQILAFTALNGFLNAGTPTRLLLAATGCPGDGDPAIPIVAGTFLAFDFGGEYCIVPSAANDRNVSVDCRLDPEIHPNVTTGYSSLGSPPPCDDRGNGGLCLPDPPNPSEMIDALAASVSALGLPTGTENALLAKLSNARRALDRGKEGPARNQLGSFVHQVEAQRGGHIDEADAEALIEAAEAIIALLPGGGGPGGQGKWLPSPEIPSETIGGIQLTASSSNRSITIRYELPEPSVVDLAVFDVRGRRVHRFEAAASPAGRHVIQWNGRDASGSRAAPGVYFVRLTARDGALTRKVVLLAN